MRLVLLVLTTAFQPTVVVRSRRRRYSLRETLEEAGAQDDDIAKVSEFLPEDDTVWVGAANAAKVFVEFGFTGPEVAQMLGNEKLLSLAPSAELRESLEFLSRQLKLKKYEVRKVGRSRPDILVRPPRETIYRDTGACPAVLVAASKTKKNETAATSMRDVVLLLASVGIRDKYIKYMVVRWPQILAIEMAQLLAVTDFFVGVGFDVPFNPPPTKRKQQGPLGALFRQAPWLLATSVGSCLRPAVDFLREEAGVQKVDVVIRAYPRCLRMNPETQLKPRIDALRRYGVTEPGVIIETFPLIFGLDVETMDAAVEYWTKELKILPEDVPKICRAFPSLLGVNVTTMEKSVSFLKDEIGISNIGRFVTRLPPVLAYDVDTVLRPKMAFAVQSALSVYDVSRFPAYFSYPLDDVIRPRAAFLKHRFGIGIVAIGLANVLTPGDREFATLAKASPEQYATFKRDFLAETVPSSSSSSKATPSATMKMMMTTDRRRRRSPSVGPRRNETRQRRRRDDTDTSTDDDSGLYPPPILRFPRFPT